jgi:hypothetical protein
LTTVSHDQVAVQPRDPLRILRGVLWMMMALLVIAGYAAAGLAAAGAL